MRKAKLDLAGLRFSSNRAYGGEGEIKILAEDINRNGMINPITVKAITDEGEEKGTVLYEVVAGRRRVLAATELGWKEIDCHILEGSEAERAEEIAGSENINRLAMHPLDEAKVFVQLLQNGRPIEELAKQYDRKVSEIYQRTQLLNLSDNVKTLFRNGIISLHSAAMLNTIDAEAQNAFCEKFKDKKEIGDWDAVSFVSQRHHDRLYKCITDEQCETCKTRTFFGDINLFPELSSTSDFCLNHECYLQKWVAFLSEKIKNLKTRHKTHLEASLMAYDDPALRKILGKQISVDGAEYTLTRTTYNNPDDKPGKNSKPCFKISLSYTGQFEIKVVYWKEGKQEKAQHQQPERESNFAPAVKLLGLPKEEAETAIKAFEGNSNKLNYWQLDSKLQQKHFWHFIEEQSRKEPTDDDIDLYLKIVFSRIGDGDKKIFKLFTGNDYSEKQIPELKKLPKDKLFGLLVAMSFSPNDFPDPSDLDRGRNLELLTWLGVTKETVKELYRADILAMIPKSKPEPKPAQEKKPTPKKTVETKGKK
jgi:ParB/RepB/Spo0J family partition protein